MLSFATLYSTIDLWYKDSPFFVITLFSRFIKLAGAPAYTDQLFRSFLVTPCAPTDAPSSIVTLGKTFEFFPIMTKSLILTTP